MVKKGKRGFVMSHESIWSKILKLAEQVPLIDVFMTGGLTGQ